VRALVKFVFEQDSWFDPLDRNYIFGLQ
jgi:hypothetical protein